MSAHFSQVFGTLSLNNSNTSLGSVRGGNSQRFVSTTHRPAGLPSTEMSKNVRFLTMVTADGQLYGRVTPSVCTTPAVSAYSTGTGKAVEAVICGRGA
jgi:hypothetical protein